MRDNVANRLNAAELNRLDASAGPPRPMPPVGAGYMPPYPPPYPPPAYRPWGYPPPWGYPRPY